MTEANAVKERNSDSKMLAQAGQAALKRLFRPIATSVRIAQVLTIFSGVLSVAPYVALVVLGNLFTQALAENKLPSAADTMPTVYLLLGMFFASVMLHFIALLITHFSDLKLRDYLRRHILERIAKVPLAWFTENNSGMLRKAIQDDTITVHTVIAHGPIDKLRAKVAPLSLVIYAFIIDWRLGLLSIATLPIYIGIYSIGMKGMDEKTAEMDGKLGRISSTMVEFASGISVVKAFGRTGKAHGSYIKSANDFSKFYADWCKPLVRITAFSFFWISIPLVLLVNLGFGSLLVNCGYVTVPELLATTLIALAIPVTIQNVAIIVWSYQLAGGAAVRICKILDTETLPQVTSPRTPGKGDIEIQNVSYSYGDTEALKNINLTLKQGTITALLGPSGSGKSTLAKLIARFADPTTGCITLGGVDLRDIDEKTLYEQVAFVLQDAQLLQTSIRNNIALGRTDATLEEVRAAAKIAQIDDFIMSLPNAYDTVLGRDMNLSGGQEQRIAIARAVLIDAPVMILDEATAFADPESETEIQKALSILVKNRTVLAIAHRPASIRGADQLVLLERGEVIATGTHEDLLEEPHYQHLLAQSFSDRKGDEARA